MERVLEEQSKSPCHHSQHNQTPERTTAIPPARIAVLIQAKKQQKSTQPTKPQKQSKMVMWPKPAVQAVQHEIKINLPHTAHREKSRDPSLEVKPKRDQRKQAACYLSSPAKKPSLTVTSQYASYNCASIRMPIIRNSFNRLILIIIQR